MRRLIICLSVLPVLLGAEPAQSDLPVVYRGARLLPVSGPPIERGVLVVAQGKIVAVGQDGPVLHVHVVLGRSDGTTRGGHLLEAQVYPTLEAVVTETPARLRKVMRPDIGIALIDLDQSEA